MSEQLKILKVGRKEQPSKYTQGQTYTITTILDEKGRKLTGIGKWTENWKLGDVITGNIAERKWTDKDGFEQLSLTINNPEAKQWTGRGGAQLDPVTISYQLAASLASLIFAGQKKVTLADIDKLAKELKTRIDVSSSTNTLTEVKDKVPEIRVDTESESKTVEDDEEPF